MTKQFRFILCAICGLLYFSAVGLTQGFDPNRRLSNRETIDTLRWGQDYKSAEMLRRARRAQSLDSTYFVGYMMEGYHYYDRAEEQTGLRKAIKPLRKAIDLFESEYGKIIKRRYSKIEIMRDQAWQQLLKQMDYLTINSTLIECYQSLEMTDSTYAALLHLRDSKLVFDYRSYQGLAWLFFRNRVYTNDDHPYLQGSIEGNIQKAFNYTDSLQAKFDKNKWYIRNEILGAYPPGSSGYNFFERSFMEQPQESISNTLGILYGYDFEPKKAANYFLKMANEEGVAKMVNLGFTYHSAIDFRKSEEYFAKVPDRGAKSRGGHWQGYSSIFVFKGEPQAGVYQLQQARDQHGYTIGYGWDNLCLARMYLYSGYLNECRIALDKADKFAEVHFNTSFREDQYRFMLKILKFMLNEFELNAKQFENRQKWISWNWWRTLPELGYRKITNLYQLSDDLALNPERDIVYYHIFHSESIVTFDELWPVVRNFSNDYFEEIFTRNLGSDPRQSMSRYYNYYLGKLGVEKGDDEAAYDQLAAVLRDPGLDREYEKLLIGRIHEACAAISAEYGWEAQLEFHLNELYRNYPQLIPFSDARMAFKLKLDASLNSANEPVQRALDQLYNCNIDFIVDDRSGYPELELSLGEKNRISYTVRQAREIGAQGLVETNRPDAGKALAYRLFKILR